MPKQLLIGVYKVCAKWTNGGKRYYQVIGWTEAGDRVRSRFDTEDLAKAEVNRLIGEDEKIRLARRQQGLAIAEDKCVFDSNLIRTKARLDDIEAGLRLFPQTEAGMPNSIWSVKEAIARGLQAGYNPTLPDVTVADVALEYIKYYEWRHSLPTSNLLHVATATLKGFHDSIKRIVKLFGTMKFSSFTAPGALEKAITNAGLVPSVAEKVAATFNGMGRWGTEAITEAEAVSKTEANAASKAGKPAPAHRRYLSSYTNWSCSYRLEGLPQVFSNEQYQILLDNAWSDSTTPGRWGSVSRAATLIMRIACALRPSETDHPDFHVLDDFSFAFVPKETKTGFRLVEIPPCAQIQLRVLKNLGLLRFDKRGKNSWAIFRGKAGFPLSNALMRAEFLSKNYGRPYESVGVDEAKEWFRSQWPLRYGKLKPDVARHTGGTAYANACQDLGRTAKYMGNGIATLDHYLGNGLYKPQDIQHFYQTIATPLKAFINPCDIPLPSWFNVQHSDACLEEQRVVTKLSEMVIAHVDEITTLNLGGEEKQAAA